MIHLGVESFHKTVDIGEPGDQLGLLLRGIDAKDKLVKRGCVIIPKNSKIFPTDRFKAQVLIYYYLFFTFKLYLLKPDEGGRKMPLASYFSQLVYSLTFDCGSMVKIIGKDFLIPGEHGE